MQELLRQVLERDFIVAGRAMLSDSASGDIRHRVIGEGNGLVLVARADRDRRAIGPRAANPTGADA